MATNNSEIKFANDFSEIKFIRRVLLEFGVFDETNSEIDKAIILAKIEETQDRVDTMFSQGRQENKK